MYIGIYNEMGVCDVFQQIFYIFIIYLFKTIHVKMKIYTFLISNVLLIFVSCTKTNSSSSTQQVNLQFPNAPTSLSMILTTPTTVSLKWSDQSSNEQGFKIERKDDSGNYTLIATVGVNVTTYVDANLLLNKSYTYRVSSFNAAGTSVSFSNLVTVTGIRNGLLAFYPFNGNSNDESGNGNSSVVNGATLDLDRFGNLLSSYSFNGNSFISINNKNLIPSSSFSISCWIKLGTLFTSAFDNTIIGQWSSSGDQKFLLSFREQNSYRGIGFYLNNGSSQFSYYNTNWIPNTSAWYHVVAVYSPGNYVETYVNGHLIYSSTTTNLPSPSKTYNPINTLIEIGHSSSLNRELFFVGNIDDVKIYNRELSINEISYLYSN